MNELVDLDEATTAEATESTVALPDWKNRPTVADLKQHLEDADSNHKTQITKMDTWLDNLHVRGKAKVNTPEGSSKIVPRLIRKQAEWRYAALSEPFLSTPDLFSIQPVSWEDRKSAQQNQLILNNQFNTKINKNTFIDSYVRSAVDEGTIIVRVGWDFEEEEVEVSTPIVTFEVDTNTTPLHNELLRMSEEDPTRFMLDVPDELKQAFELSKRDGVPYRPVINGYRAETEIKTVKNQPTLEVCDYHNVVVDPSCLGDPDKAGFIIYSFETSLSDLKMDGRYFNLDAINVTEGSPLSDPDHVKEDETDFNFKDKPRTKFVAREYWGSWDIDGDGKVKQIVATWVGNTLIRLEENPYPDKKLPFVFVPYLPVSRQVYGEPDGHLLEDNQKVSGAVTRGMIDILAKSANGQTGIRKDALDITNRRKYERGQDYEFNANIADPRQVMHMHTFPEIPSSAQFMLQLQNMEAESITGVKAFSGGISGEGLGQVAAGVRGALDAASKRELGILRRLADGMITIGRKIISMNAEFLDEQEVIRVTNEEFVAINRDDLSGNFDMKLSITTAEEDNAKAQELAFMLQTTAQSSDPEEVRMIRAEIARLRKMPDLAKRIEEYQPEPSQFEQEKQALELELLRAQIKQANAQAMENAAEAKLDSARAGTEVAKSRNLHSDADQKDLNFVEQESGVTQERELQKQSEQARGNMALKDHEFNLKNRENNRSELSKYLKNP